MKKINAFTLVELMVVVVIVAVMAAYAIPAITGAINNARVRDAGRMATAMHAAALIFEAQNGDYYESGGASLATFNTNLNTNFSLEAGYSFSYQSTGGSPPTGFLISLTWDSGGSNEWQVDVDEGVIAGNNPCCQSGACTEIPAC